MIEIRKLEPSDRRDRFSCGVPDLDEYLRSYAGQNQWVHQIGVTYVAVDDDSRQILGYMTMTMSHGRRYELPQLPASMPGYPLPLLRIARLAVDHRASGVGIGSQLLLFAFELAVAQADRVGCVGLVVDAKADAVGFYQRFGFTEKETVRGGPKARPRQTVMFLALSKIRAALA